jgi:hypothetical protein
MNVRELIEQLSVLPGDDTVCLDCRRCGAVVIGDVEVEKPGYVESTVWLAETS